MPGTVLVLGATGFIGTPLVRQLAWAGHSVIAVSRSSQPAELPPSARHARADRAHPETLAATVKAWNVRTVIDLIAMNAASTSPLLVALDGLIDRYVLVSSCDVYRNFGGLHRKEALEPLAAPLTEDAPLRASWYPYRAAPQREPDDPLAWMDDYDKIPIEAIVQASPGITWTILRLPMVFGPGDRQRRFAWAIRRIARGRPRIPLAADWAAWRSTYGYVEDIAAGIALAATHPRAERRIYNLGMAKAPTNAEWAGRIGRIMGWNGTVQAVSLGRLPQQAARRSAYDFRYPLAINTQRARRDLGYAEIIAPKAALQATIDDELSRPEPQGLTRDLAEEDMLLAT